MSKKRRGQSSRNNGESAQKSGSEEAPTSDSLDLHASQPETAPAPADADEPAQANLDELGPPTQRPGEDLGSPETDGTADSALTAELGCSETDGEQPLPDSSSIPPDSPPQNATEQSRTPPLRSDVAPRSTRTEQQSEDTAEQLAQLSEDESDLQDTETFLKGLVESLLFSSPQPLSSKDIARLAGVDRLRAKELIELLASEYAYRGLTIEEVASGYVMRSAPRYGRHVQKLLGARPVRLSRAQLETLAIIAYRQPVTKPEVDDIRGVDSGQVIKGLLERSLVKILGKKDEPGRPMLYGTTTDFLELLNLQSLKDLPTLREYSELSDESRRKFVEETGDDVPIVDPTVGQFAVADEEDSAATSVEAASPTAEQPAEPPSQAGGEDPPLEDSLEDDDAPPIDES